MEDELFSISHTFYYETYIMFMFCLFVFQTFPFGRESWSWVQTAQCANVQTNNIQACNGVIYIIDKVFTCPFD